MNIGEAMRSALDGIVTNKVRSFLTTLGIIIGVAAVIALVSVAEGSVHQVLQQIEAMGANLITINAWGPVGGLTIEDVYAIAEATPELRAVAPEIMLGTQLRWGLTMYHAQMSGVGAAQLEVRNRELAWGRFISDSDVKHMRPVAVVGETTVNELFRGTDPVGQIINIQGQEFTVIGVVKDRGNMYGSWENDIVMLPITVIQRMMRIPWINTLYGQLADRDLAKQAVANLRSYLSSQYAGRLAFDVQSQEEILNQIEQASRSGRLMLGAIAGIALLVGGIGIMNIMLVSVTERTREIGLRKALGAKRRSILGQFLIEAVTISLLGALFGVAAGIGVSRLIDRFTELSPYVTPSSVLLSVGFAASVGIVFGIWPAIKAARLQPIVALRYE